jgi:hypothetical protein
MSCFFRLIAQLKHRRTDIGNYKRKCSRHKKDPRPPTVERIPAFLSLGSSFLEGSSVLVREEGRNRGPPARM